MPVNSVSGTDNPYASTVYTAKSNEKNTLTITSYIQLLATQLQNQDLTNPMDNNEMMGQMTQMAMVQALSSMTETMTATSAMSTTTYVAGMVGKEVTVAITEAGIGGVEILKGSKKGIIESVNLTGSSPTFRIQGDSTDHPLSHLLGIGDITDSVGDGDSSGEDLDDKDTGSGDADGVS